MERVLKVFLVFVLCCGCISSKKDPQFEELLVMADADENQEVTFSEFRDFFLDLLQEKSGIDISDDDKN